MLFILTVVLGLYNGNSITSYCPLFINSFIVCLLSLKPLGLDAMLTYNSTNCNNNNNNYNNRFNRNTIHTNSAITHSSSSSSSSIPTLNGSDFNSSSSVQSPIPTIINSPSSVAVNREKNRSDSNNKTVIDIEKSLVRHIRYVLPLESLRELSEEIGFDPEDLQPFRKKLEV